MRSRPARIAGVLLVLALAGCGGDDDDASSATTQPATASTAPDATVPAQGGDDSGPNATVSPDIPPEVAAELGPVEVQGDKLPAFEDGGTVGDPAIGLTAPVVIGEDFDGNTIRIDASEDGPTLVTLLAHWCPHCNREVPWINELRDEGAFPEDLNIVGISTGITPQQPNWPPSEWFQDMDWTYPVMKDGYDTELGTFIAADAYGLSSYPFMVLIDGDGKVLARTSGEQEKDELLQFIEDHLPQ